MDRVEVKACDACRKAKKKCSRQLPVCTRCTQKGLDCVFPMKPTHFLYGIGGDGQSISSYHTLEHESGTCLSFTNSSPIQPGSSIHVSSTGQSLCPSLRELQSAWFLTPNAWAVEPVNHDLLTPVGSVVLKRYISKTQDWLRQWVATGKNPFIHSQLYKKRLPRCVQDAFTAVSSYVSKTPATEDMIHRIIEERVAELVESQDTMQSGSRIDTFDHLSRVQMLLVYSIIRLFDGDIRQRHLAERNISTLHRWTVRMLATATQAAHDGYLLSSNNIEDETISPLSLPSSSLIKDQERLLWHAWILSESVRRTWFVSVLVMSIYEVMQRGCSECPGGMMLTTRRGAWEAESAFMWTKMCAERSVGFMHRNDTGRKVLGHENPDNVDPFCLALMELDYGLEKMERWRIEVGV